MSDIAFLLPGQGAQHPGMAVGLYGHEPVFTAVLDEFFGLLGAEGASLRRDWLAAEPEVPLDDGSRAQPLLFVIGYALGRALAARGVVPAALVGHSIGELAAAALAGVFDLRHAARILAGRSRVLATVPDGGLLAVAARPDDLAGYLTGDVVIGAYNAPAQTMLAGPAEGLAEAAARLTAAGIVHRPAAARQPFHSPAMAGAAARFAAAFTAAELRPPEVPIHSTRTAAVVTADEAVRPEFWAEQLVTPVRFGSALDSLLATGVHTLVELGPGRGLSMLALRHPLVRGGRRRVLSALPARADGTRQSWAALLDALS
ncbi:acyltransferase domain-containing protein [Streptomyces sp. MN03-5084-2B]|nr:acyltransferase domain-containing protein [Streptomyces sp. MN03-5084-2B]